jgi:hypothetical protein
LSKKFKAAKKGKRAMKAEFEELDSTIGDESRTQWEEEEELARNFRGEHLKIYEVRMEKGMWKLIFYVYLKLTGKQSSFISRD